jgi:glycosidase
MIKPTKSLFLLLILAGAMITCNKPDNTTKKDPETKPHHILLEQLPDHVLLYEVNLRAFSQAGNLQGVTDRLDKIVSLGVNVIWLMPIFPIGQLNSVNSPYCVQNFKEVNPELGNMSNLLALVDSAHSKGIAVILDWVANHTAWDNPWIENTDWYTQVDGEIIHPAGTNWTDVADLNYDNQEMRSAMIDAMSYWITEANIDGFRCDAADFVPFDFWQQAISSLNDIPNRNLIFLAEGARSDHFQAGFQMNFSWNFYNQLKAVFGGQPASLLYTTHLAEYQNVPAGHDKLRFTTNHDESAWDATPVTLFRGKQGALAASVITTYMGGVPLIYGSQEVGVAETIPFFTNSVINWDQNPDMFQAYQDVMGFYINSSALLEGDLQDFSSTDVVCFLRSSATEDVFVAVNVRNNTVSYTLPSEFTNTSWTDTYTDLSIELETALPLESYSYEVLTRNE